MPITKITNEQLVKELKEVLAAMEVKEVNKFKIRAYQNAISAIQDITSSVFDLWEKNRLGEIAGVGTALSQHISELFETGSVKEFKAVKKDLPQGMFALIGIRGIGARKAFKLATAFNLDERESAVEKLKKAAEKGKIQVLEGFGEKSEKDILSAISDSKKTKNEKKRMLLPKAEEVAGRVITYIKELDCVYDVEALGSLRRKEATVGDIDLVVATSDEPRVIEHFVNFSEVADVLAKGESRAAVVLKNDVQVDIRVIDKESLGAMMQYFTGSKQHNVILRSYALDNGFSLSEYGVKDKKTDKLYKFSTEKEFYNKIGLPYIVPELRQGRNEVELAIKGSLPDLIVSKNVRGDLHTHTTDSDGVNTLNEMVVAAIERGYEYLGNADHAPSVQSRGRLEVLAIIENKRRKIEQINNSQKDIRVLFGYEINILNDESLALPDEIMSKLDYAIASIHTSFDQPKEKITARLINAIRNPHITIIGHPSGRVLNERNPCEVDWDKVFAEAVEHNKIIEINAQPSRSDLSDDLVREALRYGVKLMINTDAHSTQDLALMDYGINVARRGGCSSQNIENTKPLAEFLSLWIK